MVDNAGLAVCSFHIINPLYQLLGEGGDGGAGSTPPPPPLLSISILPVNVNVGTHTKKGLNRCCGLLYL